MIHRRNLLLFTLFLVHTTQFLVILLSLSVIDNLSVFVIQWRPCDLSSPRYTCDCHVFGLKQHSVKAVNCHQLQWTGLVYTSLNFVWIVHQVLFFLHNCYFLFDVWCGGGGSSSGGLGDGWFLLLLLLLLLLWSSSPPPPLCGVFTLIYLKQPMFLRYCCYSCSLFTICATCNVIPRCCYYYYYVLCPKDLHITLSWKHITKNGILFSHSCHLFFLLGLGFSPIFKVTHRHDMPVTFRLLSIDGFWRRITFFFLGGGVHQYRSP